MFSRSSRRGAVACRRGFFDKVGRDWERAWTENVTPWELQSVNPSFVEGLALLPKTRNARRVLVPGCGSGFDLLHLHANGWEATGLDISHTAIDIARKNVGDDVDLQQGDFFTYAAAPPFDVIYDYLFFAAIDPSMRPACAVQFHALLQPTTGRLLTLLFPLAPPSADGPPYTLTLDVYKEIFGRVGLTLESTHVPTQSIKPRKGRELLAVWSRAE
ncbi:Aste57867_22252 [Aphanomyces stellatus]|uniref:Aste57867_22252 protein n=1 Tax=Aphanomyces stellatus TaxID=120398 RepID=A0A485LKH5_9STRA|nr:hypothetical protein As57867_022182 [Aphanomyces stellatus]VFT98919.1 Aste57867_22252 [Aphanomyces stellatus]